MVSPRSGEVELFVPADSLGTVTDQPPGRGKLAALPGPPPPVSSWATRADLVRDRAHALRVLHRADMSARTALANTLIIGTAAFLFLFMTTPFLTEDEEVRRSTDIATVSVSATGALALSWWALRRTLRAREISRRARAWRYLEEVPEARALPRGELDPGLREPFDARADPDFDRLAGMAHTGVRFVAWENRVLARSMLTGLGVGLTIVMLLSVFYPQTLTIGLVPAGLLVGTASAVQAIKIGKFSWRETKRWRRMGREIEQWRAERAASDEPS